MRVETCSIKARLEDMPSDEIILTKEFLNDILANGILHPLTCEVVKGEFFCLSGFRRLAAALFLGVKFIPVVIRKKID